MKKVTFALATLFVMGLTACSSNSEDQNAQGSQGENLQAVMQDYKGQVIFSQNQGKNLRLTVRKNDCNNTLDGDLETIIHEYDSTLTVGACVRVSDGGKGVKNVSTW